MSECFQHESFRGVVIVLKICQPRILHFFGRDSLRFHERPGQLEMIHDYSTHFIQEATILLPPTGETAAALAAAIDAARTANGPRIHLFLTSRRSNTRLWSIQSVESMLDGLPRKVRLVDMVGQASMCVQPFAKESPPLFSLLCNQARSSRLRPLDTSTRIASTNPFRSDAC